MTSVVQDRRRRTVSSALWAAYGDSLGFMTELADEALVKLRTGLNVPLKTTVAWRRLQGGKFGAFVELPAGTYSDDTQLRLATGRCIRNDGHFDIESFAKVELPVWLGYSLGSGLGSKAAATSLSGSSTTWYSNFYRTDRSVYIHGGGNGAAMRVQPHVWAAPDLFDVNSFLKDVVRNAIATHGHVRGIAGAMIHAATLSFVFTENRLPRPEEWVEFSAVISKLPALVDSDGDIRTFWLPIWQEESETTISHASQSIASEWESLCAGVVGPSIDGETEYAKIIERLGGLRPDERGSGLKSAFFSLVAAWSLRSYSPGKALAIVANLLQSDTDTIATMAGALIGALPSQVDPIDGLQDREYLVSEANRLFEISLGKRGASNFAYPDLLYWQLPKSPLDMLGRVDDSLGLYGLGRVEPIGDVYPTRQSGTCYQWFRLEFGQTVLCKRRTELRQMSSTAVPSSPDDASIGTPSNQISQSELPDLFDRVQKAPAPPSIARTTQGLTVDFASDEVIQANFNATMIGKHLLKLAEETGGLELAVAFAAIVVKARRARLKKGSGER